MKFNGIRSACSLLLVLCMLPALRVKASEIEQYTLTGPADGPVYCYMTPFTVTHTIAGRDGGQFTSGTGVPAIYRLVSGSGDMAIAAYCADGAVEIRSDARYRRINLEDSTYFSDTIAGKLRSVLLASYPKQDTAAVQAQANAWLQGRELPEIEDLQSGEAILAAQIAIWKLTGSSNYTVHALYGGTVDLSGQRESVVSQKELYQQATSHTQGNVESLYTYFYNLPPSDPAAQLVSDSAITRTVYSASEEDGGSYRAEISVTVSAEIGEGDSLTLTAACGDQMQSQPLTVSGEYQFSFSGLPAPPAVKLEITGEQYGDDVFLFDAEGEQEASKTLIGYDSGLRPVRCERMLTPVLPVPSEVYANPGN